MWKRFRIIAGFFLIVIGIISLLLPIIPSTPFFLAGVAMVGADHPLILPLITRLKQWRKQLQAKWKAEEQ